MKTFTVNYFDGKKQFSHSYDESWEITEYFCPNCGEKEVWEESSAGDYYVGTQYLCLSCKHTFYLPSVSKADSIQDIQRLTNLK